jgi:hypothetical protein
VGSLDDGNKSRIISYRDQEKGQIPSRIMVRLKSISCCQLRSRRGPRDFLALISDDA